MEFSGNRASWKARRSDPGMDSIGGSRQSPDANGVRLAFALVLFVAIEEA
jgi:hypothetical protein